MTAADVVSAIFAVYRERGHRHYGESVTELQHALQTATFAQQFGEPDAVVVAALLHDYGHLDHDAGEDIAERGVDMLHENLGAHQLSAYFGPEVIEPVRLHVAAKRYLCGKHPAYHAGLSEASRRSLQLQGGLMTDEEIAQFEANPHCQAAVRLRRYDDMGKVPEMATPDLEAFRPLVESLVRNTPPKKVTGSTGSTGG